jgi:myo-inositol-1(or 4)-monophosphatase
MPSCTKELEVALSAAQAAGTYLRDQQTRVRIQSFKGSTHNYATAQDVGSESIIVDTIRKHFPGAPVLAEESFVDAGPIDCLWIIDPLDGTRNYANGLPFFSVSIAFYQNQTVQAGVVYAPCVNDELFYALRNDGVYRNGQPLHMINADADLPSSVVATGFSYFRGDALKEAIATYERVLNEATDVVRHGSAALDLCYVAAGRLGAYYETGLKCWDVAAGKLLLEEAGGKMVDYAGGELDIFRRKDGQSSLDVLAAKNMTVSDAMLQVLRLSRNGRDAVPGSAPPVNSG